MALISDGNGSTCAAGGESQVAGTLVGVSVGPADGARAGDLVRGRLGAPAGAPHTVRAQVLVQQTAPTLAAPDPCARTCSTLCTLLRTVVNHPRDRRFLYFFPFIYIYIYFRSTSIVFSFSSVQPTLKCSRNLTKEREGKREASDSKYLCCFNMIARWHKFNRYIKNVRLTLGH